jgi:hypothetical protein
MALQAKFLGENLINYFLISMKARFNWIPYIKDIQQNKLEKHINYNELEVPYFAILDDSMMVHMPLMFQFNNINFEYLIQAVYQM